MDLFGQKELDVKFAKRTSPCLSLLTTLIFLSVSTFAEAGTVKSVSVKKKTMTVTLDDGEEYEKDTELCVFNDADKKIECGTVTRTKAGLAQVKFKSAKKLKRIKAGMTVRSPDAEAATTASDGKAAAPSGKMPFRIWGAYSPALATPAVFNKIGYEAPADAAPDSLWRADSKVATALFGFNLQVGIPLGTKSLNTGLRFRTFTPSLIDSDYIAQKENPYVRSEQKASAIGLWTEFQYLRIPMMTASSLWVASGLDIDMSTVTFTATKLDDSGATAETEIASADSKLTVASLRTTAGFDFVFAKPLGGFFGITLMIPLAEFGAAFKGNIADDEARGQADPGEDLKTQLGHKKNSVAYEVSLGGMLSF